MKKKSQTQSCDINFGKVLDKSVKVYVGEKEAGSVEILGSRGNYSIWTDKSNENLASLRGKSGSLKEVKSYVSQALCNDSE